MGIHYLQSMQTKIRLGLQLCSYQCSMIATSCVCVLNLSMRLSPLFATRLIHAQCVSKIIPRSLSVGLELILKHLCSIDAVDVLIQRKKLCTYFYGIQSSVMNMLIFLLLLFLSWVVHSETLSILFGFLSLADGTILGSYLLSSWEYSSEDIGRRIYCYIYIFLNTLSSTNKYVWTISLVFHIIFTAQGAIHCV